MNQKLTFFIILISTVKSNPIRQCFNVQAIFCVNPYYKCPVNFQIICPNSFIALCCPVQNRRPPPNINPNINGYGRINKDPESKISKEKNPKKITDIEKEVTKSNDKIIFPEEDKYAEYFEFKKEDFEEEEAKKEWKSKENSKVEEFENIKNDKSSKKVDLVNKEICGIEVMKSTYDRRDVWGEVEIDTGLVTAGSDAPPGTNQWMASLWYKGGYLCGSSIVDRFVLITAAHCFVSGLKGEDYAVTAGSLDIGQGQLKFVDRIIPHPFYKSPYIYHDIAIVILKEGLEFDHPLSPCKPVCLGLVPEDMEGKPGLVAGFGLLSYGGIASKILQEAVVKVVSNKECNEAYQKIETERLPHGITPAFICAGGKKKDACQGDSGGPLVMKRKDGKKTLIGVVSFGHKCGVEGFPGIYSSIKHYLPWIKETFEKEKITGIL